ISMASTIRAADTQHWAGKAPSLSNGKRHKRALGAARKRDRSIPDKDAAIAWSTDPELADVHALRRGAGASDILLLG
ncbi:hypothetical protein MWU61_18395, partial [Loktanella sp. F6476L]|nr:hypothetical protein [Loktanella sp. F6476L]